MARNVYGAYLVFCIIASLLALNSTTEWPLPRCSRNDPNANNCMLKAAQISLPKVMTGIPSLRLPSLEPMKMGDQVLATGAGPISLQVNLKSASLSGVSNVRLDSAKFNKKLHRLDLDGFHKELKLSAQYVMKGKIFFVPISNEGFAEITFRKVHCDHSFVFAPRNGQRLDAKSKQTSVTATPVLISLDVMHMNLTAHSLGAYGTRTLNNLMNSNWQYLYTSFKPSIETWLRDVYTKALEPLFVNFNYEEMFPEIIQTH